jgi:hypothetical protein
LHVESLSGQIAQYFSGRTVFSDRHCPEQFADAFFKVPGVARGGRDYLISAISGRQLPEAGLARYGFPSFPAMHPQIEANVPWLRATGIKEILY